jgi:hypothetical protein
LTWIKEHSPVDKFVAVQQKPRAVTESTGFHNLFRRKRNFGDPTPRLPISSRHAVR